MLFMPSVTDRACSRNASAEARHAELLQNRVLCAHLAPSSTPGSIPQPRSNALLLSAGWVPHPAVPVLFPSGCFCTAALSHSTALRLQSK